MIRNLQKGLDQDQDPNPDLLLPNPDPRLSLALDLDHLDLTEALAPDHPLHQSQLRSRKKLRLNQQKKSRTMRNQNAGMI